MKTQFSMLTSSDIKTMIDNLDGMNDDDVRDAYGFDTAKEAEEVLAEEYSRALEDEEESIYEANGFSCAYDYNSFRY